MQEPNEIKLNQVLHGKNQDVLKDFPPNFFDSVVTDAPYELGMMGKKWDSSGVAYNVAMWKEVLRVAKPGATLFCFGGTRTYHRVACAIEDAGWLIKDSLMFLHGAGFPKSTDISKALDKEVGVKRKVISRTKSGGFKRLMTHNKEQNYRPDDYYPEGNKFVSEVGVTNIAKQWTGYGTALKPAFEPIILAMAPLEKGLTYAQNARKWGVAGLNIDAGRIGIEELKINNYSDHQVGITNLNGQSKAGSKYSSKVVKGRWPANVILSHSPDCVQVGTENVKTSSHSQGAGAGKAIEKSQQGNVYGDYAKSVNTNHLNADGTETIDVYACVPGCPIRIMDTQSGQLHARGNITAKDGQGSMFGGSGQHTVERGFAGDSGGASRFFYTAKASRSERESGLKDFVPCVECGETGTEQHTLNGVTNNCIRNNHCTVKPLSIMEYLCELIRMPERRDANGEIIPQVILDPFCGSGTTLLAADKVGFKYIGIDMEFDNVIIASSRSVDTLPDEQDEQDTPIDPELNVVALASNAQNMSPNDFSDLII